MSSLSAISAPTVGPGPRTVLITPRGMGRPSISSVSRRVVNGVISLGFITTVQPAASAGASFHDA